MLLSLMGRIQAARITAEDEGQALVEYGILVGLIAVACIVAVTLLGTQIAAFFDQITTALGG
ncbi:MAG TPA: Flp family type IVb pilin [Baekduia sp.]|nr:Flp family type IVb pilin [Baekduia sp.]